MAWDALPELRTEETSANLYPQPDARDTPAPDVYHRALQNLPLETKGPSHRADVCHRQEKLPPGGRGQEMAFLHAAAGQRKDPYPSASEKAFSS